MTAYTESVLNPLGSSSRAAAEATVLVIDDDPAMRDILNVLAQQHGFALQFALDGTDGLRIAEQSDVDLVLLDLGLPGVTGFDVCRRLRGAGLEVPIIMVSGSTDVVDVVVGLEIGADDYINKPFRPRELLARIAAHLRKAKETRSEARPEDGRLIFRDLVIDTSERRVMRADQDVILTHTEFDLLAYLATNAGKVLSRERILSSVWGYEHPIETRVIDVHVRNLRRKIEPDPAQPRYILAVPGIGYRFAAIKP